MSPDYPRWTRYSHGNPRSWRRIYCGRLLYVIPVGGQDSADPEYTWHDANAEPHETHGPYADIALAMEAAERYASGRWE